MTLLAAPCLAGASPEANPTRLCLHLQLIPVGGTALKEGEWLHALGVAAVLLDGLEDISPRGGLLSDGAAADTQLAVRDLPQALLLPAMEQGAAVR